MPRTTPPEPGAALAAVEAVQGVQQTFTRAEVALLMHLAFDSGRTAAYSADLAERHTLWATNARRPTYDELVAGRLAEMDHAARARAVREGRPYRLHPGGPVDWETGEPIRPLRAVA